MIAISPAPVRYARAEESVHHVTVVVSLDVFQKSIERNNLLMSRYIQPGTFNAHKLPHTLRVMTVSAMLRMKLISNQL